MATMLPPIAWEYKGKEMNIEEPEDNLQIAKIGDRVLHDVFDMCTILPAGIENGKMHVKLDEDGSERQLTVGHFRHVIEADAPPIGSDGANVRGASGGLYSTDTTKKSNAEARPCEASTCVGGDKADNDEPAGDGATGGTGANVDGAEAWVWAGSGQRGTPEAGEGTQNALQGNAVNEGGTQQNAKLLAAVLERMEAQVDEFGLMDDEADLVFHKRLAMIDTKGIKSKDGSSVEIGKAIRDRGCGHFFAVVRVYKPLLGYLAEHNGICVDSEDARDTVVVVMHNASKVFGTVWTQAPAFELSKVFDTDPLEADVIDALGADYKTAALEAATSWPAHFHTDLTESYPGGGKGLTDSALKGASNVIGILKRKRPQPFLTAKEAADAKDALEAAKEEKAAEAATQKAARAAASRQAAAAKAAKTRADKAAAVAAGKKQRGAGAGGAGGAGGVGGGRGRKVQIIDDSDDGAEEVLPPPSKRQAQCLHERNNLGQAAQQLREPTPTPPLQQQPQQPPAEPTAERRDSADLPLPTANAFNDARAHQVNMHVEQNVQQNRGVRGEGTQYMYTSDGGNGPYRKGLPGHIHQQPGCGGAHHNCYETENVPPFHPQHARRLEHAQRSQHAAIPLQDQRADAGYAPAGPPWLHGLAGYPHCYPQHEAQAYFMAPPVMRQQYATIPLAAFEAKAAFEAQQKADAISTHAKFMYYCKKYPGMMRAEDE